MRGNTMKSIQAILNFISALRYAGKAANLSRNGKYKQAQAMYRN
jgi:hypothetical protein